eukprot:TRINITY_DN2979_c0_g1_i1.p1 TRINITY_DN2979_c0_g1~~TRINITY_DN2979_c0_g1_i1.p1  ORF type:complete len:338 (-),score=90.25 TRINITY_DN2979_c0_g1_i1:16-1029(-)
MATTPTPSSRSALDQALQEIGMLAESASQISEKPSIMSSTSRPKPKFVPIQYKNSAPTKSPWEILPQSDVAPRKRKGKHRKPKANPAKTSTSSSSSSSSHSDSNSDEGEFEHMPTTILDNAAEQIEDSVFTAELQQAMEQSRVEAEAVYNSMCTQHDEEEVMKEQCRYLANTFPGQKVLVQLQDDKNSARKLVSGTVWEVLSTKPYNEKGVKVLLVSGDVGRVRSTDVNKPTKPQPQLSAEPSSQNKPAAKRPETKQKQEASVQRQIANSRKPTSLTTNQQRASSSPPSNHHHQHHPPSQDFVECPIGCGARILVSVMDMHVDECLTSKFLSCENVK